MNQKILGLIVVLYSSVLLSSAQNDVTSYDHHLRWENEQKEEEVSVEVTEGTKELGIIMTAMITSGNLRVVALAPSGKQETYLYLINSNKTGTSNSSNSNSNSSDGKKEESTMVVHSSSQQSKGSVMKAFTNPEMGTWSFIIEVLGVTGEIKINFVLAK